jgi:hypothetical protein
MRWSVRGCLNQPLVAVLPIKLPSSKVDVPVVVVVGGSFDFTKKKEKETKPAQRLLPIFVVRL